MGNVAGRVEEMRETPAGVRLNELDRRIVEKNGERTILVLLLW
jgi:hypothetical protein